MKIDFYILMGVSGSGKTTIGEELAGRLGWDFYDADDYHPPENVAKMASGYPLDDDDRAPWLATLHDLISGCLESGRPGVLACSALKESYRRTLLAGNPGAQLIYLKGDIELIWPRMSARRGHYMKPGMLRSQFEALEEPDDALVVDISRPAGDIVAQILENR